MTILAKHTKCIRRISIITKPNSDSTGTRHKTGDVVTIVSVNGESRVKLFDDSKTYIDSVKADGTGGIIEYVATFPNMTVKNGDIYKACVLTIKDSNLICEAGTNSPALRPEFIDISGCKSIDDSTGNSDVYFMRVY